MQSPLLALLAAGGATAHMLLSQPQMFPGAGLVPFNNGPITTNYPCRGDTDYSFSFARTVLAAGSNFTMKMEGGATHGGGSCQVSLSKDLKPTKDSTWKVIHSVQGGCPVRNNPGNIGDDAYSIDPDTYSFEVPAELESGQYTYAWTWLNKVGNREFYMNCAPVQVTGGKAKRDDTLDARAASYFDSLPNMFYANIPESDCTTKDSTNMIFAAPGPSLEINSAGPTSQPTLKSGGDMNKCYAGGDGPGGSASGQTKSSSGDNAAAAPAASSVAPVPSSAPAAAPTSAAATPIGVNAPTATWTCAAGTQSCSAPGSMVCIGTTQFGLCDTTGCMIPQAVASGTQCLNGAIAALSLRDLKVPPQARHVLQHR